jgi:lipoprotein-anchoring transpeptidase ErfK/SrfK
MNENHLRAKQALAQAKNALQNKDHLAARHWAYLAANLAPDLEDVWLFLAALADPHASHAYLKRALEINPSSQRARKGMLWNARRLRALPPGSYHPSLVSIPPLPPQVVITHRRPILLWAVFLVLVIASLGLWTGILPVGSLPSSWQSAIIHPLIPVFAQNHSAPRSLADLIKPTFTPTPTSTFTPTATFTSTPTPTSTFTPTPTDTATPVPTDTMTPQPTYTPQPPEPTSVPVGPVPGIPGDIQPGERWIDIDLTHQTAYAFEGDQLVNSFIVSTGTYLHPTVTGQYHIYVKYRYADMAGPGYYLPDVPYVTYFYQGYGLHGTYWHHNFGHPMSHGCVNFKTEDAGWLYNWDSVGTLVNIHY